MHAWCPIPTASPGFRSSACLLALTLTFGVFASPASSQTAPIRSRDVVVHRIDSGDVRNFGPTSAVLWKGIVEVPGASWIRLKFDTADLAVNPATGESSRLTIAAVFDEGAVQYLGATTMREWNNTSAYFNGSVVYLELTAVPGTGSNHIVIQEVIADDGISGGQKSICGPTDDRLPSQDPRQGRAMPIGCTAWMFDDNNHCFITAGHCVNGTNVVQFNVPLSKPNGQVVNPRPEDQYAVDGASRQGVNGGIGNDWGYFGVFDNSTTGLSPFEKQGSTYLLKNPPPFTGQPIRITGYGTVSPPISMTWNQIQKTHVGPAQSFSGTTLQYFTDTSGGNSGSPVVDENNGVAIGVHTHAGCPSTGNRGTASTLASWQEGLQNPKGVCAGCPGTFTNYGAGLAGTGGLVPAITGTGCASAGQTVSIDVSSGLGGASGTIFVGFTSASVASFGGTLLVVPAMDAPHTLSGAGAGAGTFSLPLSIPNVPTVKGLDLFFQGLYLDSAAPAGISMTDGLQMTMGI